MARTFNRRPLSVNTPSSSDLKEHFFNHYNWKGMDVNKNFLAADQETFEDCNNVYMNAEGILRSRPAIKQTGETAIVKFWNFQRVNIYLIKDLNKYKLDFYVDNTQTASLTDLDTEFVTLIPKERKIFIFTDTINKFTFYDLDVNKLQPAKSFVYIPETETIEGENVKDAESPNLMYSGKIISYEYLSDRTLPESIQGKNITATIDSIEYNISSFDRTLSPLILFKKESSLPGNCNHLVTSKVGGTTVRVAYELSGSYLISIYTKVGDGNWTNRDSFANKTFYVISFSPGISDDGQIFYLGGLTYTSSRIPERKLYFLKILESGGLYIPEGIGNIADMTSSGRDAFCKVFSENTCVLLASDGANSAYAKFILNNQYRKLTHASKFSIDSAQIWYNGDAQRFEGTLYSKTTNRISAFYASLTEFAFKTLSAENVPEKINDENFTPISLYEYNMLVSIGSVLNGIKYYLYIGRKFIKIAESLPGLSSLSSRFSDGGTLIFLPIGIYSLTTGKYADYLNRGSNQTVTVHNTGNDSYYSILADDQLLTYSNVIDTPIILKASSDGNVDETFISNVAKGAVSELDNYYVSYGSNICISELKRNDDNEFLWYFPKKNEQKFAGKITALQPISSTEMAVFLEDEVHYTSYREGLYYSYKSKLKSGLLDGSDVITSYDGTNVIFPSERGLVALSYQNFVASTDQTLTYLSDAISEQFKEFVKHPVKLLRYQFWILAYSPELTTAYLLDLRNNSWWPMSCHLLPIEFYVVDNEVVLLSENKLFKLDKLDENYYDYDGTKRQINWNVKSQKLHLNAVNYYKHISNLTLYSVLDTDSEMNFVMDVNNYRKQIDTTEIQTISYKVDTIRTFVKRVSYPKVNEFQYNMHQDDEREIRLPLSLSGITIKYKISGQVR